MTPRFGAAVQRLFSTREIGVVDSFAPGCAVRISGTTPFMQQAHCLAMRINRHYRARCLVVPTRQSRNCFHSHVGKIPETGDGLSCSKSPYRNVTPRRRPCRTGLPSQNSGVNGALHTRASSAERWSTNVRRQSEVDTVPHPDETRAIGHAQIRRNGAASRGALRVAMVAAAFVAGYMASACSASSTGASMAGEAGADEGAPASDAGPTDSPAGMDAPLIVGVTPLRLDLSLCSEALPVSPDGTSTCRLLLQDVVGGCGKPGLGMPSTADLNALQGQGCVGGRGGNLECGVCQLTQVGGASIGCTASASAAWCYAHGSCLADAGAKNPCQQAICTTTAFGTEGISYSTAWLLTAASDGWVPLNDFTSASWDPRIRRDRGRSSHRTFPRAAAVPAPNLLARCPTGST